MTDSTRTLAWACALLAISVTHAAYLISAQQGYVPWCWPYWDGCTSISRAARHGDANLLFKLVMLPVSGLIAWLWWRLRALSQTASVLGLIAAFALAVYVINLGLEGTFQQWLRRFGITFHFAFTVLGQLLITRQLRRRGDERRLLLIFGGLLIGLGLASLPLQHWLPDRDRAVNAIEWCYALLMALGYPLMVRRRSAGDAELLLQRSQTLFQ